MADYEKKVREMLKENGCWFIRHGKGDHDIWYSPETDRNFPVDHVIKYGIMKQAGIDHRF